MEETTKHRMRLPLYDLEPRTENCWIAPNATLGKFNINNNIKFDVIPQNSWRSFSKEMGNCLV